MILYKWDVSEKIPAVRIDSYPCEPPEKVEQDKTFVLHFTHTGHKRCKGPYHRNKAGINDRTCPVLLKIIPGLVQSLTTNDLVISFEHSWANVASNG
jgi:hypothetical protein